MQDICREAALSPGAVYRYFASKEEIIAASCQGCHQQNLQIVLDASEQSDDPLEVLDMLVDSGFGWLGSDEAQDHLRMNIQLWAEALRSSQVMESFKEANLDIYRVALTKLMVRAQELGQIEASLDPEAAARVLLSTWHGLVLQKAFDYTVDVLKYVAALKSLYNGTFSLQSKDGTIASPEEKPPRC